MKRVAALLTMVLALLLAGRALAMSSTHYRLEWFTPLTSGGGGPAFSAHYAVNFTVGQTVIGSSSSAHSNVELGYWCSMQQHGAHLPLILRNR